MNNLETFNFNQHQVRTIVLNNVVYFVGKDVAIILGYTNPSKALQDHVDDDDKLNNETLSSLGQRGGWLINESGLYSLVLSSKLPSAKAFKKWVTSEVLPSIRKTGTYSYEVPKNFKEALLLAVQQQEEIERLEQVEKLQKQQLAIQAPKAIFADAVASSHTSILIGDLAKLLKQNGVEIGQNRLFEWLRENGYLMKSGVSRNMPTQKSMSMGLFEVKERTILNPDGSVRITKTTKVTGKGQQYFVNKFLGS